MGFPTTPLLPTEASPLAPKPPDDAAARDRRRTDQRLDAVGLVAFFVLAYSISWAWELPLVAGGQTVYQGVGWPTHMPALLAPMVAAFIVTAWRLGRVGVRDLVARTFRWDVGWRWWAAALSPLLFLALAMGVVAATGNSVPSTSDFAEFSGISSVLTVVGVLAFIVVVNGFGEEVGWRGFALPNLQRRFSPLTAALIVAGLWAAWHLPMFFLVDNFKGFSIGTTIGFVIGLTCGSVVATWLYNRSGASILMVVIWHSVYNLASGTAAASAAGGTIAAVVSTLIMVQAGVLIAVEVVVSRRGRASILGPPPEPAAIR